MHAPTMLSSIIIDAVRANKFVVIDDHKSDTTTVQLAGIGIHVRGEKETVVALFTKEHSDYYTVNEVKMDEAGIPHLTRNACAGTIFNATDDVRADVKANHAAYDWDLIAKHPALHPGTIVDVITSTEHDDHIGSPLYFEHALMSVQMRINTAKHLEHVAPILKSKEFDERLDKILEQKVKYFDNPTRANAVLVQKLCLEARAYL